MPDTGTPIDEIRAILESIRGEIKEIREHLAKLEGAPPPKPTPEPQLPAPTGGIYDFLRPVPVEPRHGLGRKMYFADVDDFIERSRYAVRYSGQLALDPNPENEAWREIEEIQTGNPGIIKAYTEAGIDPLLIAVLLMQGIINPIRYDGPSFGNAAIQRAKYVGLTPQSWLENQFAIMTGGPKVSGGD